MQRYKIIDTVPEIARNVASVDHGRPGSGLFVVVVDSMGFKIVER